jgi:hypothetical protein
MRLLISSTNNHSAWRLTLRPGRIDKTIFEGYESIYDSAIKFPNILRFLCGFWDD